MNTESIVSQIDQEIARLQHVRSLLTGSGASARRSPGRPKKSAGVATKAKKRRGGMSAEGRKRVAEAQRKRWAAIKAAKNKK